MEIVELVKIGSILIIGSIVQSSAGFGFALLTLPLLLFMGFNLPQAVIITVVASAFQKITAVSYLRKSADVKGHLRFIIIGLLMLPVGVYCQYRVSFLNKALVGQMVGVVVILMLILQVVGKVKPRDEVRPFWGYMASVASGFLDGLANIGGPPLVLWVLSHTWSNEKTRVTPLVFSLFFMPLQIIFMALTFGSVLWGAVFKTILVTPVVIFGSWLGVKIGSSISKSHLVLYMRILLLFIALSAIIKPFL